MCYEGRITIFLNALFCSGNKQKYSGDLEMQEQGVWKFRFWWGSFWSSWGWFLMVTAVTGISTTDSTGKPGGRLRLDHQQSLAIIITNGLENEKTATNPWWWDIMLMFRILAGWGTQGLSSNRQSWLLSPDSHRKWEDVTVAAGHLRSWAGVSRVPDGSYSPPTCQVMLVRLLILPKA